MAQQMKNGSYRKSDVTFTFRDSDRYAVVNPPFCGKHKNPQTDKYKKLRKLRWACRHAGIPFHEMTT